MAETVYDAAVVLAAVLGLGVVVFVGVWLWAKVQRLPPTMPSLPARRDKGDAETLLTFPAWRKRNPLGPVVMPYERPLDVLDDPAQAPDDAVLLPPRNVAGRNGEA